MSGKTNITGLFDVSGNLTIRAMEKYLRGELSMAEREIVQKHLDGSPFDREALEGFQKHSSAQLDKEIKALQAEVRQMTEKTPKTSLFRSLKRTYWYAAAAIVVLFGVTVFIIFMVRGPVIQTQLAVNQPDTTSVIAEEPIREDQKQAISEIEIVPVAPRVSKITIVEDDLQIEHGLSETISQPAQLPAREILIEEELPILMQDADDNAVAEDNMVLEDYVGGIQVTDASASKREMDAQSQKGNSGQNALSTKMAMDSEAEMAEERQIFMVVEQMPDFPGGEEALYKFLAGNITYPQSAKESGIQGRVYVTFVVERDGSINDVRVLRGIGGGCDEEAIRVIKAMPKWIPGKQRAKPVRVQYNLPVKFSLE